MALPADLSPNVGEKLVAVEKSIELADRQGFEKAGAMLGCFCKDG
jgi:hypothetical protein